VSQGVSGDPNRHKRKSQLNEDKHLQFQHFHQNFKLFRSGGRAHWQNALATYTMQQAYSLLQTGEAVVLLRTCRKLNNSKLEDEKDYNRF